MGRLNTEEREGNGERVDFIYLLGPMVRHARAWKGDSVRTTATKSAFPLAGLRSWKLCAELVEDLR